MPVIVAYILWDSCKDDFGQSSLTCTILRIAYYDFMSIEIIEIK